MKDYINRRKEGDALAKDKKDEKAIEAYEQAIKLNPKYYTAYAHLGNVLTKLKMYDEAIKKYDEAIKLKHNYVYAYRMKGDAYFKLYEEYKQDQQESKKYLEHARENYLDSIAYSGSYYQIGSKKFQDTDQLLAKCDDKQNNNQALDNIKPDEEHKTDSNPIKQVVTTTSSITEDFEDTFDRAEYLNIELSVGHPKQNIPAKELITELDKLYAEYKGNFLRALTIDEGCGSTLIENIMCSGNKELFNYLLSLFRTDKNFIKNTMPYQDIKEALLINKLSVEDVKELLYTIYDKSEVNQLIGDLGWNE